MLWTINFNEIYRQHASITDLYLRKISINLVAWFLSYDGKCKCCVRSAPQCRAPLSWRLYYMKFSFESGLIWGRKSLKMVKDDDIWQPEDTYAYTVKPRYNTPHYSAVFNITWPCHGFHIIFLLYVHYK